MQTTQQLFGAMDAPLEPIGALGEPDVTLADFERHHELGRGGNAAVYLATFKRTGQRVALKVIHGELASDPKYLGRFRREVRATSQIVHPHVCRVYAFGEEGTTLWLAMEVLEGGTIRDLIDRAGRLPPQIAAALLGQLLDALQAAHGLGVLHRDIKPANAMVTSSGVLKLVDFGIAKGRDDATVTETGFLVGTPAYMSPEQAVGREIDVRADLYAVGVSLYEMLIGKNPYADDTPSQALLRIASEALPSIFEQDPTVPGAIEALFEHLTERRPEDRLTSSTAALAEIQAYLDYVRLVHPNLLSDYVVDPIGVSAMLRQEQAELEVARAERMLLAGDANLPAAGLALYRAQLLHPQASSGERLATVTARAGLQFGVVDDDEMLRARDVWTAAPSQAGPVKRLADLYRARGDIHRFVVFIRRYLRLRPTDSHAQHQLETAIAGVPVPTTDPEGNLRTRDILAGVRTGGWAAVTPERKAAVLALQQPTAGRRTSTSTAPSVPAAQTQVVARAKPDPHQLANERIRAAATARPLKTSSSSSSSSSSDIGERVSDLWHGGGRQLLFFAAVVLVVVGIFRVAARSIEVSVDRAQVAVSDNAANVGAIENNDVARRQNNLLKDATAHFNNGDHLKVIVDVNNLLGMQPPGDVALRGLLLRARARSALRQNDAARLDYEEVIRQTPLTDPTRTTAMQELNVVLERSR